MFKLNSQLHFNNRPQRAIVGERGHGRGHSYQYYLSCVANTIGYQWFVTISIIRAVSTEQIRSKQKLPDPLAFQDSIIFITEIPECSLLPITYLSPCCLWHSLIFSRSESTFSPYLLILHGTLRQVNNRIQLIHCPTVEEPKCMDNKLSTNSNAIQIKLIFSSFVRKLNNLLLLIPPILLCGRQ